MQGLNVISIHALLAESDSWYLVGVCLLFVFLSTLSLRRATWGGSRGGKTAALFLSTLSLRRATSFTGVSWSQPSNFYPRSPCGERLHIGRGCVMIHRISIHALLAESDPPAAASIPFCATFLSTLSLRRATAKSSIAAVPRALFLSTLSLRRATPAAERLPRCRRNFYPRSPCGERRPAGSVRAARRGGFLSTLSLRRATVLPEASPCTGRDFYPRSPCGERPRPRRRRRRGCYFYPRSPCGERRSSSRSWVVVFLFLSTLSLRRATVRRASRQQPAGISIHALLAESDNVAHVIRGHGRDFYPRSPCGERLP